MLRTNSDVSSVVLYFNQITQRIVTKEDVKAKVLRKVTKKVGNPELLFAKQQKLIEEQQQITTALVKEREK